MTATSQQQTDDVDARSGRLLTDELEPVELMALGGVARRARVQLLLLRRLPQSPIRVEHLRRQFSQQFLENSSSVNAHFVLSERVFEGDLDDVLQPCSDGVQVGVAGVANEGSCQLGRPIERGAQP